MTRSELATLRGEAVARSDSRTRVVCDAALNGNAAAVAECGAARLEYNGVPTEDGTVITVCGFTYICRGSDWVAADNSAPDFAVFAADELTEARMVTPAQGD